MKTKIVKIGNSQGIVLSKSLLNQYHFQGEVEIEAQAEGLLIKPVAKPARHDWDERFQNAIAKGQEPDGEMLEGFENEFDKEEWK